jgi:hypothetical protein
LEEALTFSAAKRDLLLSTVISEQQNQQDQWERALGILWDVDDLANIVVSDAKKPAAVGADALTKTHVRVPLGLAVSGEFFAKLAEPYQAAKKQKDSVRREAGSKDVIDVGQMSTAEAKAFWKRLG